MKRKLLSALILLITKMAFCQQAPVMDSTWLPKVGDKYYIDTLYSGVGPYYIPANDTGANVTWDLNAAFALYPKITDSFDFVLPATRLIQCRNQMSNFATGDTIRYYCYDKDPNGIFKTDSKTYINLFKTYRITDYTKPEIFMKSNFHFREVQYDTSKYNFFTIGYVQPDSLWMGIKTSRFVYDGYGTLKVAGKTYDSAIRIHENSVETDSTYDNGSYIYYIVLYNSYYWFIPSIHAPLISDINTFTANRHGTRYDTISFNAFQQYIALPNKISAVPPPPSTFNNTTANMSGGYIVVHNAIGKGVNYAVYDAQGKLVASGIPEFPGDATWRIAAGGLSAGTYILKLQDQAGAATSIKLVKDH